MWICMPNIWRKLRSWGEGPKRQEPEAQRGKKTTKKRQGDEGIGDIVGVVPGLGRGFFSPFDGDKGQEGQNKPTGYQTREQAEEEEHCRHCLIPRKVNYPYLGLMYLVELTIILSLKIYN